MEKLSFHFIFLKKIVEVIRTLSFQDSEMFSFQSYGSFGYVIISLISLISLHTI